MDYNEILEKGAKKLNVELSNNQSKQLMDYMEVLLEWNKNINLTAIEDKEEIIIKHFLDSMTCLAYNKIRSDCKLIDIGTGAGFPGIVLKIVYPDINVTLVDSLNKRINFLNQVIKTLKLSNIKTIHSRSEDLAKDKNYREMFDICVSRAVANLSVLSEYCLPFVKIKGYFSVPSMGNNLVVKVHYGLGSRNR